MDVLLWSVIAAPALLALIARLSGPAAGAVGAFGALLAAGPAVALVIASATGTSGETHFVWLPAGELEFGLRLDGLSATMSALVAVAGAASLLHARGYFAAQERAPQAHAALLAFLAAMQGLVLATNFLTLLVFWELVGALSARLIAYEREDPRARPGAIRAFLTTRGADTGLYVAIAALHAGAGSLAFDAARPDGFLGAAVGVGIVLAAAGKSAQLPFQTWLSGAMAGPAPVSALLHSATMVAAGVYLLVRAQDLLAGWPLEAAAWLGAITAVAAAAFALAQRDLKLILASSTTSQLGLMFVAAGAALPGAAVFQLIAHAAGKAAMFLAAGLFQRRRDGTSLEALEGVGRQERWGFWGFAISAASIAAVPPLAAFWSKDAVLRAAEEQAAWFVLVALASAGTAAYLLRPAVILWRERAARDERQPRGRPWMLAGIALLVAGSLGLGALHPPLAELLGQESPSASALTVGVSLAALAAGIGIVAARLRPASAIAAAAEAQLFTNAALRAAVQRPVLAMVSVADRVDAAIDGVVDGLGRATLGLARGNDDVERRGVDAAVDGLARAVRRGGDELPRMQSGQLYEYLRNSVGAIALVAGVLTLVAVA
jgi:NADH-quinone oxidoreductase subunit L